LDIARKSQAQYSPDQIIVSPGAKQAILMALMTLLNPGEEVLTFEPCWHSYKAMIYLALGEYKAFPVFERNAMAKNKEQIEKLITTKTKVLIINNPQNPTGVVWSREDLQAITDLAKKHDLWIIADETYDAIIFDDYEMISLCSFKEIYDKVILINGFSKTYAMTGLRIGYLAGPLDFISQASKIQEHSATCASSLSQYAALGALSPKTNQYVETMRIEYEKRRDLVYQGFNNNFISFVKPQGTFYAFLNIKKLNMSSIQAAEFFLSKAKIASVPGTAFGNSGEGFLRISFAKSSDLLEKAVKQLNQALYEIS
ncbi:MAG: aminotransferase class I/II-fold pyridoxal phosphate-dependent enzyme, partial [Candidatus Pacebacteria bacterium]|nr:aminotransferase class I/II-fold pyridoxal phosphate-dependent enzyme [Candidatus Paceibacterota bacterium]